LKEEKMAGEIQVDAWSAFVPDRGSLQKGIKEGVIKKVSERGIPKLEIKEGSLDLRKHNLDPWFRTAEPRDYLFFVQHLGKTASIVFALRIAKRGMMDLELSWRLFEGNIAMNMLKTLGSGSKVYFGIAVAGAAILAAPIMLPVGLGLMLSGSRGLNKNKTARNLTTEQQLDSRILAQTIDFCLMKQLEELGISGDEVRVLEASHMEGIGRLGASEDD
jgi:hypothetical protein